MTAQSIKSGYTEIQRGTKKHRFLQMCQRPEGVTYFEAMQDIESNEGCLASYVNDLLNMNGYDIRRFSVSGLRGNPRTCRQSVTAFRCVGRFHWDGGYTDFAAQIADHEVASWEITRSNRGAA